MMLDGACSRGFPTMTDMNSWLETNLGIIDDEIEALDLSGVCVHGSASL
jgi:hypothetical protein